jgi:hypothetical protein
MDWANYEIIHQRMSTLGIEQVLFGAEPLSNMLFWLSQHYFGGSQFSNFVAALILLGGVFSLARRTEDPWLAVVAATPYLIIVVGMSGIRQAMAMGVFLFALARWDTNSLYAKFFVIFIATLFHVSAIVLFFFPLFEKNGRSIFKYATLVILGIISIIVVSRTDLYAKNLMFYEGAYLSAETRIDAPGAMMHLALVLVPAVMFLIMYRKFYLIMPAITVMRIGSFAACILLIILPFSSVAVSRLSIYLYFIPMIVYPAFSRIFGREIAPVIKIGIVIGHFLVLFVWLNFANNSLAYRYYSNIILTN